MFDLLIRGGTVIDGQRTPRFRADVGISGDRIAAIGELDAASASRVLDADGKIVAPAFIDVHTHSDGHLLTTPHLEPKTRQGFATEVLMADGISYAPVDADTAPEWFHYLRALNALPPNEYAGWHSIAEYLERIAARCAQNVAAHVPYANIRALVCGFSSRRVDDYQMRQIQAAIEQGMDEGAVGLSTGLDYISQCFATTDEIAAACVPVARRDGLYVTHIRYKIGLLEALREAVEIGRRSGAKVHISHLKATTPELAEQVLTYIDQVARHDVDFSFDVYPYLAGSTMLSYLLPYEVWEDGPLAAVGKLRSPRLRRQFASGLRALRFDLDRLSIAWVQQAKNKHHQGKLLSTYVDETGLSMEDALCDLLIEEQLGVLMVIHEGDDALVHPFLRHDCFMLGTDGIYFDNSVVHPRIFGSVGRLLGSCVRDARLFSLEEAVYKAAGYAARRFGFGDRGVLREQAMADIAIFDEQDICDPATYTNPHQPTEGIDHLLVNGVPILLDAVHTDACPGRYLKSIFA